MLITIFSEYIGPEVWLVKIRYYEKVTKFEKISHLFLLISVKTSGKFFQIFVAFSEKLNFTFITKEKNTAAFNFRVFRQMEVK